MCLDPYREGQQDMLWHHPCKVIQLCSLEKNLKKQCCKIWDGSWNWHCIWSLLHSKKVRCVSHDTSHILNNPIVTSEKISKSPHAFKRHCKIRLPFWDGSGLLWLLLRSELEGHPGMLTHHPLQSFQSCSVEQKLCCKMWYNPSNWHWSIQYRDWYLDTSQNRKTLPATTCFQPKTLQNQIVSQISNTQIKQFWDDVD